MSETARPASAGPGTTHLQNVQPTRMTAWVGGIAFAGIVMMMLGSFHVFQGLIALFNDEYFLVTQSGLAVSMDFTAWGWVHLLGGVLVLGAGFGVFSGALWARTVGVMVALGSAVINIGFLSAYPLWSSIMILLDILIIWALTVHGGEMREG